MGRIPRRASMLVSRDRLCIYFGFQGDAAQIRKEEPRHNDPLSSMMLMAGKAQDLRLAWSEDPVALMQTKGTPEVHERPRRIN